MLQPRETILLRPGGGSDHRWIPFNLLRTICIVLCICIQTGLAQNSDDVFIVEPTPALRLNSQDLTTILLLNNNKNTNPNNRGNFGRHHHHHANVGLLTSTARTFIQEGVTTEYATQVLGTTLDNGRLYAQLLKKSSRVLYDKDQNGEPTIAPTSAKFPGAVHSLQTYSAKSPRTLLQSHNDLVGDKDWQLIDDHLLLVNKDQLSRTEEFTRKAAPGSVLVFPAKSQPLTEPRFANQSYSVSQSSSSSSSSSPSGSLSSSLNIAAQKVLHAANLPTYTIKNVFAPSGFSWDSPIGDDAYVVDERAERVSKFRVEQQPPQQQHQPQRTPKLLQQHDSELLGNDLRTMATVTYFGFADFTTIVGDTVIVFSPSTSSEASNQGQVTSIKGEATLNGVPQTTAFVNRVPITVTQDLIEPTFTMQHVVEGAVQSTVYPVAAHPMPTGPEDTHDDDQGELTMPDDSDYEDGSEEYVTTTEVDGGGGGTSEETTTQKQAEDETPTQLQSVDGNRIELEPSVVPMVDETSATTTTTTSTSISPTVVSTKPMLSRPSNEDISKIFASLASLEAAKKLAAATTTIAEPLPPVTTTSEAASGAKPTTDKPQDHTEHMEAVESTTMEAEDVANNEVSTESIKDVELNAAVEPVPTMPNKIVDVVDEAKEAEPEKPSPSPESITPDTHKVSGGVTTIFFEDDPFSGLDVTPTQQVTTAQSTAAVPPTEPPPPATSPEPAVEVTTVQPSDEEEDEVKEEPAPIEPHEADDECPEKTSEVIPTLVPKTLIYLTTFFISDADQTSTSIETNALVTFEVSHSTKLFCEQIITSAVEPILASSTVTVIEPQADEEPPSDEAEILSSISASSEEAAPATTTTPLMIVTEKVHVTTEQTPPQSSSTTQEEAAASAATPSSEEEEEDDDDETDNSDQSGGDEIELIYKTLYTTYTYLTTFFHESTTSVSSRKEIITNVITSTVGPSSADVSITPTVVQQQELAEASSAATGEVPFAQSNLVQIDDILRKDEDRVASTASLDDERIQANGMKTYYTTYTYFTTIFVEGETEISSRTEVYTNYVTDGADQIDATALDGPERLEFTVSDDDNKVVNDISPTSTYHHPAQTQSVRLVQQALDELSVKQSANILESSFVSSSSSSSSNEITMVTDIKSSSSDGDRHIIENINKHWNGLLEDQISSESNTDEILPSSTLLLQTSYTTFTYFTTMYIGNTASSILSRLETITNVVTETLQPTQMLKVEDSSLPITYFTTFTYWTTLYKDGEITTISREETVSNIVTPTGVLEAIESTATVEPVSVTELPTQTQEPAPVPVDESSSELVASEIITGSNLAPSTINIEPTTFYTTYTYFTTQYIGDETVINSRFETATNVNTPSDGLPIPPPTLDLPSASTVTASVPAPGEPEREPSSTVATPVDSEIIIEINQGKIVDAEGISTLLYTTKTIATTINDTPTTIVQSTSSLSVDEVKRALASTTTPTGESSTRTYKTGLVRLIDGTIVANQTTTLYQSKVIGTIIEGRYAQIIESTSSFLIEKTLAPSTAQIDIAPTAVQSPDGTIVPTAFVPTGSTDIVEGSISDAADEKEHETTEPTSEAGDDQDEAEQDEEEGADENGRKKSRLTFQAKKKTFSPVIRPFASRNRPQFAPKRKNVGPSSATIITRSDFTPTITATPALKSESSRERFSSNRKGGSSLLNSGAIQGSSRKFSRPGGSSSRGSGASSSAYPGASRRGGFSSGSRIQPTASSSFYGGSSSRRGGSSSQRGSSSFGRPGGGAAASSIYPGKSRLNIRPSSVIANAAEITPPNTNIYTTQDPELNDETATQINSATAVVAGADEEQEEVETTTESLRRPGSNLLSFRRPPLVGKNAGVSQRRNPLTQRPKVTTTTTTTTPRPKPRAFQRPSIAPFGGRPRAQPSGLFPPRGLFKPQADLNESKKQHRDEDTNDFGDDLEGDEYDDEEEDDLEDEDLNRNRRSKRQAPSFRNRFRRPGAGGAAKAEEKAEPVEEEPAAPAPTRGRSSGRNNGRNNNHNNGRNKSNNNNKSAQHSNNNSNKHSNSGSGSSRIRPTKASSSSSRAQFTLREKDTATKPSRASSFRRPTTSGGSSRRTATTVGRPKAPRLKTFSNSVTESTRSTAGRSRTTSRGRSTTRSRGTTEYRNNDPVLPVFDGTITVTHHIPTEITIPVVNGKVTEYKNIVTAQVSTEVLGPNQYNTLVDRLGSSLLVLAREDTTINNNGATEVTQFILHETPTTSVIFTPTSIRGRRTSFSHIIPSTVYDVENVVSTIQPQIAAQAPLANILLSQLLLGNIGLGQQQQLNPLLGLAGGATGTPGVPTTEFKTRTTTYVTTVTEGMSTVIPLTFRGKEILTTIFDSTVNVITATEFITDTVVVTPTAAANVQQVNSLLLPLLLQQQAQGAAAAAQPILPIQNSALPQQFGGQDPLLSQVPVAQQLQQLQSQQQNLFQDVGGFRGDLDSNRLQKVNFDDFQEAEETEQFPEQDTYRETAETTTRSRKRHHRNKGNKHGGGQGQPGAVAAAPEPAPALETSVVTLYVSGRRPGEFSTILSTVVGQDGGAGSLRKRNAEFVAVERSAIVDYGDMYQVDESEIKDYLLPATNEIGLIASSQMAGGETQSLESIVGDVSRWFEAQSSFDTSSASSSVINQSPITILAIKTTKTSDAGADADEHFLV